MKRERSMFDMLCFCIKAGHLFRSLKCLIFLSFDNRLDFVLQFLNFVGKRALRVSQHCRSDNISRYTASSAQISLFGHVDIDNVLYKRWVRESVNFGVSVLTLSSQSSGRCRMISRGSVSAAKMTRSAKPRFKALVVSLAPFFNYII